MITEEYITGRYFYPLWRSAWWDSRNQLPRTQRQGVKDYSWQIEEGSVQGEHR